MRTKRFYFVRHGRTILNAKGIRQGSGGGLDSTGREQALSAGVYLSTADIQRIIASPYERTRETANLINKSIQTKILYSPLLAERRNPSEIVGKSGDDPVVRDIVDQMDRAYHDDTYRFSDEENFIDLKKRARKCLAFLRRRPEQRLCIVTHSIFLQMLLSFLLYRKALHAKDYTKLSFFNPADNGGITICEYRPWFSWFSETRGWSVIAYNEKPEKLSVNDVPRNIVS